MTAPPMNLPDAAMPWGRWLKAGIEDTATAISREQADAHSVGSLFRSRADSLGSQIASIETISDIQERRIPEFSVTRSDTSAPFHVYDSAPIFFNPPRPDRPYKFTVVASMSASGTLFTFPYSLLRVNGVDFMVRHENTQEAYITSPTLSIMGSGSIGVGGVVQTQFALATSSTGTATFTNTTVWCIFSGSLT